MRRIVFHCLLAALVVLPTAIAMGSGSEETRPAADFVITSSTQWCGCAWGGYFPIRFEIQNRSVQRTLTLRFVSHSDMATCEKSISVAQNATIKTTLSIPVVSHGTTGRLEVYVDGERIDDLGRSISLPDSGRDYPRPSLLAISDQNDSLQAFEDAVTYTSSGSFGGYSTNDHQLIDSSLLPESWIDYTGLDLVAISLDTLGGLTNSERSALLEWVDSGGNLIVHDIQQLPDQSERLNELLRFDSRAAVGPEWIQPDAQYDQFSGTTVPARFHLRESMNGLVIALGPHAFATSDVSLWQSLLNYLQSTRRLTWNQRMGMASTEPHPEFLHFLIPSVKSVPVMSFLVLITLFTIIIGPVNYFWLWKKSRLQLLVITIPLIAFATSFLLLGYSVVSHGFGVRTRMRSVTYLDQRSNEALCVTRVSYYAGMSPRNGLSFSPDTAVFAVWPTSEVDPGEVDWTSTQQFDSTWVPSRTRTQFVTMTHRDERGRVEFDPSAGGLKATNGLEWDLEALLVSNDDGQLFYGAGVPAGGSTELSRATDANLDQFGELLRANSPALPPNAPATLDYDSSYGYGYASPYVSYYGSRRERLMSSFSESIVERRLLPFRTAIEPPDLGSRTYIAIVREAPGCDIGIEDTSTEASLHVLIARY